MYNNNCGSGRSIDRVHYYGGRRSDVGFSCEILLLINDTAGENRHTYVSIFSDPRKKLIPRREHHPSISLYIVQLKYYLRRACAVQVYY